MINEFQGINRFLSNFWPAEVILDGVRYPSVEYAYQASKTLDKNERKEIRTSRTSGEAKRLGRKITIRKDWENVKLSIMEKLVRQKFQIPELKKKLLATGNEELIEGNHWGDTFWGVCNKIGSNHLGKILMKIRTELK